MNSLITNNKYSFTILIFTFISILSFSVYADPGIHKDIQKRGDAYIVFLPGHLEFSEVMQSVENEIHGQNWQIVHKMNIGESVKQLNKSAENQILSVCKLSYLSEAIEKDPFISLIIPCRFTVFRESDADSENKGKIVVGFYDPVAEANGLELKQAEAAEIATHELKEILSRVADFYKE